MEFELSQEQLALRDSTRRLLADRAPTSRTRELAEGAGGWDRDVWAQGAELGWPALAVPEEHGGLGQQLVDLALVAVEHGRAVLPSPFLPTAVVADAIARGGSTALREQVLPRLLSGGQTAAWAFAERGRPWTADGPAVPAVRQADGFLLTGTKVHVQDAGPADWLLVDAVADGGPVRLVVRRDTPGLTVRRQRSVDITRDLAEVSLDAVAVPADQVLDAAVAPPARSLQWMTVLVCAELVGVGERLLEMTVDYARVRVQFDRPIGSFQAVKHKCATMRLWLQASTATTLHAAMSVDAGTTEAAHAVSATKSYVSDAIGWLAGEALQVHGGIGFTWEHDLHLYLRRAKASGLLYGDAASHRELLCRMLADDAPGALAG